MLLNTDFWEYLTAVIFHLLIVIKPISSQGVSCYKCMTTDPNDDACQDPFSSLLNPLQINCQATSLGKDGTFPARFCVKIAGRVISIEEGGNASYLNKVIYYRTCVIDNIMDSTNSLESSGNFFLKGLQAMPGSIRLQGFMSLCTLDGCNHARTLCSSLWIIIIGLLLTRYLNAFYY